VGNGRRGWENGARESAKGIVKRTKREREKGEQREGKESEKRESEELERRGEDDESCAILPSLR
jgi:hypothetical protein